MHYQMQMYNVISVTLCTTAGPQCDVIQSNFVFRVRVDVHLDRVHILVYCLFVVIIIIRDIHSFLFIAGVCQLRAQAVS